jgi:hypothetical protein
MTTIGTTTVAKIDEDKAISSRRKKWRLGRAALYGVAFTTVLTAVLVVNGHDLPALSRGPWYLEGYWGGRFAFFCILFVIIAFIKNLFVRSK